MIRSINSNDTNKENEVEIITKEGCFRMLFGGNTEIVSEFVTFKRELEQIEPPKVLKK